MLYSTKNRDNSHKSNGLLLLKNQVKAIRLQDQLGKQNFHADMKKKVIEPVTDIVKDVSEGLTKTKTETAKGNNKTPANLDRKFLEILNDRGIMTAFLRSILAKITNTELISQFTPVGDPQSNGSIIF